MTDPSPSGQSAPLAARGGCARILLGLLGVILILPGGCTVLFSVAFFSELRKWEVKDIVFAIPFVVVFAVLLVVGFRLILSASDGTPNRNFPSADQ